MAKPGMFDPAKVAKSYDMPTRHGTLTEFHISFEDWGKLQGIIIREAARDLGVSKGRIVFSLFRPDGSADGHLSLVRRGARAKRVRRLLGLRSSSAQATLALK